MWDWTQRSRASSLRHPSRWLAALTVLVCSSVLGSKRATAESYKDEPSRLDERTAHTVEGRHLKLGLLAIEYGITDRIAVGIDPPAWAARTVLPVWVPNLHTEIVVVDSEPFALSLKAAGYYADLQREDSASGSLVAVPLSVFASGRLAPRWWLHGEATYLFAHAFGSGGNLDDADLNGAVTTRAAQLGAMLEYRLTPIVSLTAVGRAQVYAGPLVFKGTGTLDQYTTVQIEGEMSPRVVHPWQVVGGVALLWPGVRVVLGAGYGNYFIPGIGIAFPDRTIVPDLSIWVVL